MTQPAILWQQLQQAGLVTADLPTQTTDDHQPAFFCACYSAAQRGYPRYFSAYLLLVYLSASCPIPTTFG